MRIKAPIVRVAVALLLAMFIVVDVAPALAQPVPDMLVAQQQKRRTLFDLLFGEEPQAAPPVEQPRRVQPRQQEQRQQPRREPQEQRRREAPAAAAPPPKPTVEKAADATKLAVFGDSLAVELAKALDRFYAEDPNLVVLDEGVGDSGFVRQDHFDWAEAVDKEIAEDSFDLAVVIIGLNDRQEIKVDGETLEPLSEQWTRVYQGRITEFLQKLRAARKPVLWVGLPPMSKNDYSTAISQINAIQRLASFSGGAEFLDIYERFVGEDGKYTTYGPDVNGQNARMRRDDGIHFATAGADKLAFYVSQSLRTFYRGGGVSVAVADPLAGTDAAAMLRPPFQGLGQIRLLEVAGAIIPLNRAPARAGDLLTATGAPSPAPAFTLDQLMNAPMGRVDAFGVGIDPEAAPAETPGGG